MEISIRDVKNNLKPIIELDYIIPIEKKDLGFNSYEFSIYPHITGFISKKNLKVYGEFKFNYYLKVKCARCLKDIINNHEVFITGFLVNEENSEQDEDIILINDDILEIEHLLDMALIENAPYKFLCKTDCKGLCENCGVNLNTDFCNCKDIDGSIDSRLLKLKEVLIK